MSAFAVEKFDVAAYDGLLKRGLSKGVGRRDGKMCIEAAICTILNLPHGDEPGCVASSVRSFKITLNDANWSSDEARAAGLRDLGLAQLGSLGVVDDRDFCRAMAERTTRVLIPKLFREVLADDEKCLAAALECESNPSQASAAWAARDASAAWAARAAWDTSAAWAAWAAWDTSAAWAAWAARAASAASAARAARAAKNPDEYLLESAAFALEALRELKSPGCALLEAK